MARIKSTFLSLAFSCDVDSIHKFFTAAQVQYQRACVFCFPARPLAQTMAKKSVWHPTEQTANLARARVWTVEWARRRQRRLRKNRKNSGAQVLIYQAAFKKEKFARVWRNVTWLLFIRLRLASPFFIKFCLATGQVETSRWPARIEIKTRWLSPLTRVQQETSKQTKSRASLPLVGNYLNHLCGLTLW